MVGYLRFILAALVLYSHLNYPLWNVLGVRINQGVYAVFCFYLISGFFTAAIFDRYEGEGRVWRYYGDRLLRIYPMFLAVMALVGIVGFVWYEPSLRAQPSDYRDLQTWVFAFLQPLNGLLGFMHGGDFPYGAFFAFTPVASLALEVKYFTIFPVIRRLREWVIVLIVFASTILVYQALRSGNADLLESFTYRFLVGVLPVFIVGFMLYRNLNVVRPWWARWQYLSMALGVLLFVIAARSGAPVVRWLGEYSLALITTPLLLLGGLKLAPRRYDSLAGYLSYGVFLVHIPVLRYLQFKGSNYGEFVIALVIATIVSLALHLLVERRFIGLRHRMARPTMITINQL
jgi:peptidoglycan/LPS O-acetylase OafA/YrhL